MKNLALLLALAWIGPAAPPAAGADNPNRQVVGVWNTENNRGKVELYERDGRLCAKIVGLKEPNFPANDRRGMAGKPKVDRENPDPKLRDRPLAGLEIMRDLKPAGANKWDGGHIYDPESGSTYKCKITLAATNKLEMRGFLGFSLIGRTTTWTR